MKKRLAFLLIAALLLSCLSGTALALDVNDKCPICQGGYLSDTIIFIYNWGHEIYAKCSNYLCGKEVLIKKEAHDLTGLTCLNSAYCPTCREFYSNPDKHDDNCTPQWIRTATTHQKKWGACGKLEVAAAHNWSNGQCKDCDYVCEHDWSDKNGVCKICKLPCTKVPEGATCTTAAQCSVCGKTQTNPNVHDDSCKLQWVSTSETTHKGVWSGCKVEVPEATHRWSNGQCLACGDACTHSEGTKKWDADPYTHMQYWSCCGLEIQEMNDSHNWSNGQCMDCGYVCMHDWSDKNGVCKICKLPCTNVPEGATCTKEAHCSVCSAFHQNPNVHDDSCKLQCVSTSATTHKQAYSGCGKVVVAEEAHRWGVGQCKDCGYVCTHGGGTNDKIWVSAGMDVHYLTWSCCGWYADDTPYKHSWVDGKCADCNEPCLHMWENGVCVICEMNCAHDYDPATGVCRICKLACSHDKTAVDAAVAATCTAKGLTKGEHCEICGKVLKAQQSVKALGHRYGEWTDNGDGTHSETCLRDGCGYVNTVECVRYELMVDEDLVDICPISGEFGDAYFQIIEDAACEPIDETPLLEGELLVRGLELPMGETAVAIGELDEAVVPMYGFTFVFVSKGQIVDLNAAVRLRVPMELDGGFRLVRLNVQTDAEERWTELAYVYADGVLDFETDAAGLFLLLPLEEA